METLKQIWTRFSRSCDKGGVHNYIEGYYESALASLRSKPIHLLEIGVHTGGSLELWNAYFEHGSIHGIDITPPYKSYSERIKVSQADAYNPKFVQTIEDESLHIVIDDGPHSLKTQMQVIPAYLPKLVPGGLLIIEDIQSQSDLQALEGRCKEMDLDYVVVDLRKDKGRYDDVILQITKREIKGKPKAS